MEKDNDKFEFSSYGDNSAMHSRLSAGGVSMIRGMNPMIESKNKMNRSTARPDSNKSHLVETRGDITMYKMK